MGSDTKLLIFNKDITMAHIVSALEKIDPLVASVDTTTDEFHIFQFSYLKQRRWVDVFHFPEGSPSYSDTYKCPPVYWVLSMCVWGLAQTIMQTLGSDLGGVFIPDDGEEEEFNILIGNQPTNLELVDHLKLAIMTQAGVSWDKAGTVIQVLKNNRALFVELLKNDNSL